jgi:hypothetical protein
MSAKKTNEVRSCWRLIMDGPGPVAYYARTAVHSPEVLGAVTVRLPEVGPGEGLVVYRRNLLELLVEEAAGVRVPLQPLALGRCSGTGSPALEVEGASHILVHRSASRLRTHSLWAPLPIYCGHSSCLKTPACLLL